MKKIFTTSAMLFLLSMVTYAQTTVNSAMLPKPNISIMNVLSFLPVTLFVVILFAVWFKIKREGSRLSDFLVDKETKIAIRKEETAATTANANAVVATANAIKANAPAYVASNTAPPPITNNPPVPPAPGEQDEDNKPDQSTSRLIAFISGLTTIAIAACITSYYFYRSFLGDGNINLGNLSTVLYGLGLGVVPYGFSKIAGALKN